MRTDTHKLIIAVSMAILSITIPATGEELTQAEFELDTAFAYQGRLKQSNQPANGLYDFEFQLWDQQEGGVFLGQAIRLDHTVASGIFEADLDFDRNINGGDMLWLEIHVRSAGDGAFIALEPRQRLAGAKAVCTVDGDLIVNGNIGVGNAAPLVPLHVEGGPDVSPSGGGEIVMGSVTGLNIAMDGNEIMARNNGATAALNLNAQGGGVAINDYLVAGKVGIGSTAIPQIPLEISGGTDASLGGGGEIVMGSVTGLNIAMDGNEILARNAGAAAQLTLNAANAGGGSVATGGDLLVGGVLDIGYAVQWNQSSGSTMSYSVACPAGRVVLGGGCYISGPGQLTGSYPFQDSPYWFWGCTADISTNFVAYAICARLYCDPVGSCWNQL